MKIDGRLWRRVRVPLGLAALVVVLDAIAFVLVRRRLGPGASAAKDVLDVFGSLSTAVSVVVGVFYFFWQKDSERRSQAMTLVSEATGSLRDLPADLVFLANNLSVAQAAACMSGESFELTPLQQPAFEDILGAETCEPAVGSEKSRRLRLKHRLALQGAALSYLNILESTLIARDQGLADPEVIRQQFMGFYDPEERRIILANFIDANRAAVRAAAGQPPDDTIRDDDPYALLSRFERELRTAPAAPS